MPLTGRQKLIYLALGIPYGEFVTKEELLDEIYACEISDKDFETGMNMLTDLERSILTYRFGLGVKMLSVTDIQKTLQINWKELDTATRAGMDKLQKYWWSVI